MEQKDHDILIRLSTKMDQLCKSVTKIDKENKEAHTVIIDRMDKNLDKLNQKQDAYSQGKIDQVNECGNKFLHSRVFYWITAFIPPYDIYINQSYEACKGERRTATHILSVPGKGIMTIRLFVCD